MGARRGEWLGQWTLRPSETSTEPLLATDLGKSFIFFCPNSITVRVKVKKKNCVRVNSVEWHLLLAVLGIQPGAPCILVRVSATKIYSSP